ncbi:hypothetical protein [Alteribacillus sp. YIM 98480]|uniref:hypothetical protein n=1 Tax=Alteribacillus sp. YIM 98480 TaxID=2606599 RepID=UPI00131DA1B0|nr:hypothetical protein [Alteribacillus sp. YIM 98480]
MITMLFSMENRFECLKKFLEDNFDVFVFTDSRAEKFNAAAGVNNCRDKYFQAIN